jgi:hypothetical protein
MYNEFNDTVYSYFDEKSLKITIFLKAFVDTIIL